jgi:pimeloyl-ACP methyl ester carboxylesterase
VKNIDYELIEATNKDLMLVFIHGAGGDKTMWFQQKEFFNKQGYGTLTISLSGYSAKTNGESISIQKYTKQVYMLIKELNIRYFVLVGHSMGGAITLNYVLSSNETLPSHIILIGTGATLNVAPVFFDLIKSDFLEALKRMGKYSYSSQTELPIKQFNQEILVKSGSEVLFSDLKTCSKFDVRNEIQKISIPTLIICGEEDKMTPPKLSHFLDEKIPNSKLKVIVNSGHFVFQETPDQVNSYILEFIRSNMA